MTLFTLSETVHFTREERKKKSRKGQNDVIVVHGTTTMPSSPDHCVCLFLSYFLHCSGRTFGLSFISPMPPTMNL
jgi:hypothetical protein